MLPDDRGWRCLTTFGLALALLSAASACSSGDNGAPPTSSGRGATATDGSATTTNGTNVAGTACAWPNKADKATLNVAYPDTNATYWTTSYRLALGESLELHGRFADARYLSFITYGPLGGAIGVLTDRDIQPDAGSTNPFGGSGTNTSGTHNYTVRVRSDAVHETNAVNALGAESPDATATTTASPATSVPATSEPSTADLTSNATPLGTGTAGDPATVAGTLIYRVYLPNANDDPTGGAGLPEVKVLSASGATTTVSTCPNPGRNSAAIAIIDAKGPPTNTPAPAQPVFIRPAKGAQNLYPNPDNVYVVTIVHHDPGRLVVVRGKAPSFPDTPRAPITGHEQVRYWSLCTNEYRKPYPVSFCVADRDVALDAQGRYTFVISTAADRPPNATAANGVTWLDWGDTSVDALLLLRHMLASPDFGESAINLAPGTLATTTMGEYAPHGVYCTTEAFTRGGPAACPSA